MDDHYDSGWGDRPPPLLRRPFVRGGIVVVVVVTFLLLTLVSTCSPRTIPIGTTTTTLDGVRAFDVGDRHPARSWMTATDHFAADPRRLR